MLRQDRKEPTALALSILLALSACGTHGTRTEEESGTRSSHATAMTSAQHSPPSWEELANASYRGILEQPVRLTDGRWEGEPYVAGGASRPSLTLIDDFWAPGDLYGDGVHEAVVFLAESSGGSGSRLYVAVVGRRDGKPVNLGTAQIGDRVQLMNVRLVDRRIELEVVQQGPGDAACCPTQKATRIWRLESDGLHEARSRVSGQISLADLAGPGWSLTRFAQDEPVPPGIVITLAVENGRVTGSSGCNRYFAGIEESKPGNVSISAIGTTRMACPDDVTEIESRYLEALAGVNRYSFLAGKLALSYRSGETVATLLFTDAATDNGAGDGEPHD